MKNDQPDFYEKVALIRGTNGRIQWDTHHCLVQAVNMIMKNFSATIHGGSLGCRSAFARCKPIKRIVLRTCFFGQ